MNSRFIYIMRLFNRRVKKALIVTCLLSTCLFATSATAKTEDSKLNKQYEFNIPVQSLTTSLNKLSDVAEISFLFPYNLVEKKTGNSVKGRYTIEQALTMLLQNTNLVGELSDERAFLIKPSPVNQYNNDKMGKKNMKTKKSLLASIFALMFSTAHGSEEAKPEIQKSDEKFEGIEKIVVTASRKNELLSKVASSVTSIGDNTLDELSASGIEDFVGQIPNINFTGNGASDRMLILRGISTSTFQQSATVATYIDEVAVGSSSALAVGSRHKPDVNTFDLERVEVLRGPQGSRYGANSLGGLLKYVTKRPDLDYAEFDARLDYNSVEEGDSGYGIEAAANLPVSENTAIRLSGFNRTEAGYIDNIGLDEKNVNEIEKSGARFSLLSKPADNFTILANAMFQKTDIGGPSTIRIDLDTGEPVFGDYQQERFVQEPIEQELELYSLELEYDFGGMTLKSTTAYNVVDVSSVNDWTRIEGGEYSGFPEVVTFPEDIYTQTKKWTQEFKLSSNGNDTLEWALGAFFANEDSFYKSLEQGLTADGTPGTEGPTWAEPGWVTGSPEDMFSTDWQSTFKQSSAYGELTYKVSDKFDITGGVRFSDNKTDFDQVLGGIWNCSTFDATVPSPCNEDNLNVYPHVESTDSAWTFMVSPRWYVSDDTMVYARAAQGFRPGGPNALSATAIENGAEITYDSDKLTNYEIGVKTSAFDNRLALDLTAFYIDWQDIQIRQVVNGFAFTGNGGEASSKGIELSITARPTENLAISFNLGTLNAELEEDAPSVNGMAGDTLPNAPELTHGGTITYYLPDIGFNGDVVVGGSWRHVDDRLGDLRADRFELEGYDIFNLHASVSFDEWDIRLYAKNITNEWGLESVSQYFKTASVVRPRTLGISLTTSF